MANDFFLNLLSWHAGLCQGNRACRTANESVRSKVLGKAGKGGDTIAESFKSGELLVKTVILTEGLQAFDSLEELEVDHAGSASDKPLLITEVSDDLGQLLEGFSKHSLFVIHTEGYFDEINHMVSHYVLEHQNLSLLLSIGTKELRGPFLADVEGDSLGLGDLEIAIDHIGKVSEGHTRVCFEIIPLCSAFLGLNVVNLFRIVDSSEVQNVAVDVSAGSTSDRPVAKDGFSCFCHIL